MHIWSRYISRAAGCSLLILVNFPLLALWLNWNSFSSTGSLKHWTAAAVGLIDLTAALFLVEWLRFYTTTRVVWVCSTITFLLQSYAFAILSDSFVRSFSSEHSWIFRYVAVLVGICTFINGLNVLFLHYCNMVGPASSHRTKKFGTGFMLVTFLSTMCFTTIKSYQDGIIVRDHQLHAWGWLNMGCVLLFVAMLVVSAWKAYSPHLIMAGLVLYAFVMFPFNCYWFLQAYSLLTHNLKGEYLEAPNRSYFVFNMLMLEWTISPVLCSIVLQGFASICHDCYRALDCFRVRIEGSEVLVMEVMGEDQTDMEQEEDTKLQENLLKINATELSESQCAICWDRFECGQKVMRIRICEHLYHRSCFSQWMMNDNRCPLCRATVRASTQ